MLNIIHQVRWNFKRRINRISSILEKEDKTKLLSSCYVRRKRNQPIMLRQFERMKKYLETHPRRGLQIIDL